MPMRAPSVLFLAAILLASPALARDTDESEVDWPAMVQSWIADFNESHEDLSLSLDGPAFDPERGPETLATFHTLRLDFARGAHAEAGPGRIRLTAEPEEVIAFAAPALEAPLFVYPPELAGDEPARLTLSRLEGRWDRRHSFFRSLDLLAKDLRAVDRTQDSLIRARSLGLEQRTQPLAGNRYDQTSRLIGQGLSVQGPEERMTLDRFILEIESEEADADALLAWVERLNAAETGQDRTALPPIGALWRESGFVMLLAGLQVTEAGGAPLGWLEEMRIEASLRRGEALGRLDAHLLIEGSAVDFEGSANPDLARAAGMAPSAWRLPIDVSGIPEDALGDLILDVATGQSAVRGPVIDPEVAIDADPFFDALSRAGVVIAFPDLKLASPAGTLSGGGELTLDQALPFGAYGSVDLLLGGLEEAEEALRQTEDPDAAKIAFLLSTLVKGLGQPEVGADGKIVYRYRLELGRDGTAVLNKLPLGGLLDR